jgi:(1->4)-alpha-D-glucan 1-alpha-D-glucosylmutase
MASDQRIDEIVNSVIEHLNEYRRIPLSTYRLQFNHQFKFSSAMSVIAYLHELGISDCYVSPYFIAKKGSLHGYDVLDHNNLNPEIGREKDFNKFIKELKKYGMGQILDIVPNHMSIASDENRWWMDVLENGPSSIFADFFDINWKPIKDEIENKVLLPILGDQYGNVLEKGELILSFEEGTFFIHYYDRKLPVTPISYIKILRFHINELEEKMGKDHRSLQELLSILTALKHLPSGTQNDKEKIAERQREKEVIKRRLWNLHKESREIRTFIGENISIFNGKKGNPRSFDLLNDLLNDQVYRLSHWRVATEEINFRRFFDINELAAIRTENLHVFKEVHKLIFQLIREGKVTGLRVDHVDGLYNPTEYLKRLQKGSFIQFCLHTFQASIDESAQEEIDLFYDRALSQNPSSPLRMPLFVVGEKILMRGERMPEDWPIFGTTGYGFLNSVNSIFIDTENTKVFDTIYSRFIRSKVNYQDLIYEKKKLIMEASMSGEVNSLGHYLNRISEKNRYTRDFTLRSLTIAIVETIACFPVYRTYIASNGVNERDRRYIEQAVSRAKRKNPAMSATIFDFLQKVLLLQYPEDFQETDKMEWLDFVMRFQQVTGPVMAKGSEDTTFYVYNRFVSLNEVGGSPEKFGTPLDAFHGQNIERSKGWRYALITTSTHDTKRSEDVRVRLNVLSEIPDEWRQCVSRWRRMNKRKRTKIEVQWVPDRNEEYLLYQTLVGAWPVNQMVEKEYEIFKRRIRDYMTKAAREAKVNTSWISPNLPYEEALLNFIDALLDSSQYSPFLEDFKVFQKKISYLGMFNSLSQTLLKIASPGIPDFYQGSELWDFSLVDPDNRRPIDFDVRKKTLKALKEKMAMYQSDLPGFAKELLQEWTNGAIKLFLTFRALNYRKENHQLFMNGTYIPLASEGSLKKHVCAFARQGEDKVVLVFIPRFLTCFIGSLDDRPLGESVWKDSRIVIPDEIVENKFRQIFTEETMVIVDQNGKRTFPLNQVFAHFPVAMLESTGGRTNKKSSQNCCKTWRGCEDYPSRYQR